MKQHSTIHNNPVIIILGLLFAMEYLTIYTFNFSENAARGLSILLFIISTTCAALSNY